MKLLIAFLLFIQTMRADPIRKLDSISYRTQVGSTIAQITLSDKSVWKWTPDVYHENMLRNWKEGDEIYITISSNHPGFILQNKKKPLYSPIVALTFNSYAIFPYIKEYIEDEDILILSDNTSWRILYDFHKRAAFTYWTSNDRIISVKGPNNEYELINLDIPHENRCLVERNIRVEKAD